MTKLSYVGTCAGVLALLTPAARAQVPAESLAVWTAELQSAGLMRRAAIVSKLVQGSPASLPPDTRDAAIGELNRINAALVEGRAIEGSESGEVLGEYYIQLTSLVAGFRVPDADRALILAVAVSGGVQRRVAKLGDAAVPTLARMIERAYEPRAALQTMGLAWFWADSTAAPLADASRETIVRHFLAAGARDELLLGLAAALNDTRDPAFLPLARAVERRAVERREIAGAYLQLTTIPGLESAAARLTPADAAGRTLRAVRAFCTDAASSPRRGACESVQNDLATAVGHLQTGRREPARNALRAASRRSADALAIGAFTSDEHAIVLGGVEQILARL